MNVKLTRITENPTMAMEEAASNCYNSKPSEKGKIVEACYKNGHHSILEFCDFTFHIEGVSRALLAQLTRHRVASFAVRSQRYCGENNFKFVIPPSINKPEVLNLYNNTMNYLKEVYKKLQNMGIPNEDARMILPNACETIIEIKMNYRELIHFMGLRLCNRAQWEIRELAKAMKKEIENYSEDGKKLAKRLVPKCYTNPDFPFCTEYECCGLAPRLKDIYKKEN